MQPRRPPALRSEATCERRGSKHDADSPASRPACVPVACRLGDLVIDSMYSCWPRFLILFTLA